MSELSKVVIRNFQSHEHSVIEPAPAGGLTVIVGPTDAGKSAIIRALRWILDNQPQGDAFRRTETDFVEVELTTTAGDTVVRRRTATTNRYIVNGQVLEGFGNSVPFEVQTVTGVRRVRLGDQEILANLASQLDPPFLGSSISGPNRAKVLGKLAGTEAIDLASRDLGTDMYRWRQETKRLEDEVVSLTGQVEQYSHLPYLAQKIERLRALQGQIKMAQERLDQLKELDAELRNLSERITRRRAFVRSLGDLDRAAAAHFEAIQSIDRRRGLEELATRLEAIDVNRTTHQSIIEGLGDVELANSLVTQASGSLDRQRLLSTLSDQLQSIDYLVRGRQAVVDRNAYIEKADQAVAFASQAMAQLATLRQIQLDLAGLDASIAAAQSEMSRATVAQRAEAHVTHVSQAVERRKSLFEIRMELESLRQREQAAIGAKELAERTIAESQERYSKLLAENGTCPYCGSDIDHNHVMEVLAS